MAMTAAMCIAVGKVSLEDWLMLMSSFGCSSFLPAISLPRLAMTSFAFMFDCVPQPVCQTTSGKCSFKRAGHDLVAGLLRWQPAFPPSSSPGFSAWLAMRRSLFQDAERMDDLPRHGFDADADWKILMAALGLRAPVFIGGHLAPRPWSHARSGIPSSLSSLFIHKLTAETPHDDTAVSPVFDCRCFRQISTCG